MNRRELAEQIFIRNVNPFALSSDNASIAEYSFSTADAFIAEAERQEQPTKRRPLEVGCTVRHDDADMYGSVTSYISEFCKWRVHWEDESISDVFAVEVTRTD